nr:variable surface lipoprotein [Mycoplasmopsis bovis]
MKKSKFLLLGSVASLASIPFVAAKCGETKEENKPEPDKNQLDIKTWWEMKKDKVTKNKSRQRQKPKKTWLIKIKKTREKSEKDKVRKY